MAGGGDEENGGRFGDGYHEVGRECERVSRIRCGNRLLLPFHRLIQCLVYCNCTAHVIFFVAPRLSNASEPPARQPAPPFARSFDLGNKTATTAE